MNNLVHGATLEGRCASQQLEYQASLHSQSFQKSKTTGRSTAPGCNQGGTQQVAHARRHTAAQARAPEPRLKHAHYTQPQAEPRPRISNVRPLKRVVHWPARQHRTRLRLTSAHKSDAKLNTLPVWNSSGARYAVVVGNVVCGSTHTRTHTYTHSAVVS